MLKQNPGIENIQQEQPWLIHVSPNAARPCGTRAENKTDDHQGIHRNGSECGEGVAGVKESLNKSSPERSVGK